MTTDLEPIVERTRKVRVRLYRSGRIYTERYVDSLDDAATTMLLVTEDVDAAFTAYWDAGTLVHYPHDSRPDEFHAQAGGVTLLVKIHPAS